MGADAERLARLRELADLRDRGALTKEEFTAEKARLLAAPGPATKPVQARPSVAIPAAGGDPPPARPGVRVPIRNGRMIIAIALIAVAVIAVVGAVGGGPKPKPKAAADLPSTSVLRSNWLLPGICGGGGGGPCVSAVDLAMSSGTVSVQTGWADTALVTATASGGGEVSPGDVSLAEQVCLDAEQAATTAATLAAANAGHVPSYVPVDVYGQGSALLAWSNTDGTCTSA